MLAQNYEIDGDIYSFCFSADKHIVRKRRKIKAFRDIPFISYLRVYGGERKIYQKVVWTNFVQTKSIEKSRKIW